ncbi:hypothetical protein DFS33DRAFT_1451814 [Desarmillaria ectypa]|nr:hypothetical protein DFS33DRAFT_1451814 [Desarmillaria ectypa]
MAKESASITFIILVTLEKTTPDLASRTRLCIHIFGAAARELFRSNRGVSAFSSAFAASRDCCQSHGRSRIALDYVSSYADFGGKHSPHIIAVLNSGFSGVETEGWKSRLNRILESGKPALFTVYSDVESEGKAKILRMLGGCFVKELGENKWKGLESAVPQERAVDSSSTVGFNAYFSNYRFITQGAATKPPPAPLGKKMQELLHQPGTGHSPVHCTGCINTQ